MSYQLHVRPLQLELQTGVRPAKLSLEQSALGSAQSEWMKEMRAETFWAECTFNPCFVAFSIAFDSLSKSSQFVASASSRCALP